MNKTVNEMLTLERPSDAWSGMDIGEMEIEAPEIAALHGSGGTGGGAPHGRGGRLPNFFDHTMAVLDRIEPRNLMTVLSALFHNTGAAVTAPPHHGSETVSARLAQKRMEAWGIDGDTAAKVGCIILSYRADIRRIKPIRLVAAVGRDNIEDFFSLLRARSDSESRTEAVEAAYDAVVGAIADRGILGADQLAVGIGQLEAATGISDRGRLSRIRQRLVDAVNNFTCGNDRKSLLKVASYFRRDDGGKSGGFFTGGK